MKIVRTPIRAPNANAYAERWVGTLRRECLDRILIVNHRQLEQVLRVYTDHYNRHSRTDHSRFDRPTNQPQRPPALPQGAFENTNCSADSSTNTKQPRNTASAHDRVFEPHAPGRAKFVAYPDGRRDCHRRADPQSGEAR
jgi:hypothetical protein